MAMLNNQMVYLTFPGKHIGDFLATFDSPGFLKASAMPSRMREVPGAGQQRPTAIHGSEKSQSLTSSICILDGLFL